MERSRRSNLILRIAVTVLILLLIPLCLWLGQRQPSDRSVTISEVLSSNSVCPDPSGEYRDFVELFNGSDTEVDLSGWGLSDDVRVVKYRFPEGTVLPAGAYLVVWCDSTAPADAGLAPFSLAREGGETLTLSGGRASAYAGNLPAGIYIARVKDDEGESVACKFIVR